MHAAPSLNQPEQIGHVRALALGFFDGVHLGHHMVFEAARQNGTPWSVLTFWPHPQAVLRPDHAPALITGYDHKAALIHDLGAEALIVQPFDVPFSQRSAEDFLELLFTTLPQLEWMACGPNFRFGHGRLGTPETLAEAAKKRGVGFGQPNLMHHAGSPISSSRIRECLTLGQFKAASAMLGRSYRLRGTVTTGQQLGTRLGFPTANLSTSDGILIPHGVYSARVHLCDGSSWKAAINVGIRPTVDSSPLATVEAHLIGFSGTLQGQMIEVEPLQFIRPEQKFSSLTALQAAIAQDVSSVQSEIS
jgi:riboflavin kinase / FMN adenylyltransferase